MDAHRAFRIFWIVFALSWVGPAAWADDLSKGKSVLATEVLAHFEAWDLNRDGVLSAEEIDRLLTDSRIRGRQAAALATLHWARRQGIYGEAPLTHDTFAPGSGQN